MAWDLYVAGTEITKTHKVLSRKLKEKYQFEYKDVDRRATPKLKHIHITEGKKRETEVLQYSHRGPGVDMNIFMCIPVCRCKKQGTDTTGNNISFYMV
jgi:hypothetical protein